MNTALGVAVLVPLGVAAAIDLVWMGLALGALLRKFGGNPVHAWIPVQRWIAAAREGRVATLPVAISRSVEFVGAVVAVTAVVATIAFDTAPSAVRMTMIVGLIMWLLGGLVGWVMWISGAGTIELRMRAPRGLTWLAAIAPAIWASVLGWGSYQATGRGVTANAAAAGAASGPTNRGGPAAQPEETAALASGSLATTDTRAAAPAEPPSAAIETAPAPSAPPAADEVSAKADAANESTAAPTPRAPAAGAHEPSWMTGDGGATVAQRWAGFGADSSPDVAARPSPDGDSSPYEPGAIGAAARKDGVRVVGPQADRTSDPEVSGDDWPDQPAASRVTSLPEGTADAEAPPSTATPSSPAATTAPAPGAPAPTTPSAAADVAPLPPGWQGLSPAGTAEAPTASPVDGVSSPTPSERPSSPADAEESRPDLDGADERPSPMPPAEAPQESLARDNDGAGADPRAATPTTPPSEPSPATAAVPHVPPPSAASPYLKRLSPYMTGDAVTPAAAAPDSRRQRRAQEPDGPRPHDPRPDQPGPDQPGPDQPGPDQPRPDAPHADAPGAAAPAVDAPPVDTPPVDTPPVVPSIASPPTPAVPSTPVPTPASAPTPIPPPPDLGDAALPDSPLDATPATPSFAPLPPSTPSPSTPSTAGAAGSVAHEPPATASAASSALPEPAPVPTAAPPSPPAGAIPASDSDDDDDHTVIASRKRETWVLEVEGGASYGLGSESVVLGRSTAAAIPGRLGVDDPTRTLSKLHAELEPRNGGWWVRDLGSTNGTYVRAEDGTEREVGDDGALVDGDLILGDLVARIVVAEDRR
ncbi:FHA domain-containing protein [Demequina muriae]|uniref:FHA domain-containing protein n=1 Tax=Demequina muriae TaxID=3051664 RepID=A0ABT8GGM6_9MICO|nr:FHA domain-containing protein [Demequina sp. EGI L300058]MDN4480580.1 FHA domain-containing protein [Demequina sp. EGI L300058]